MKVTPGCKVTVWEHGEGKEKSLLFLDETKLPDFSPGVDEFISSGSLIGSALNGKTCGAEVKVKVPGGIRQLSIVKVEPYDMSLLSSCSNQANKMA